MTEPTTGHFDRAEVAVYCTTCNLRKTPLGRCAGWNGICDSMCPGYYAEPHVGSLWPGETARSFGFPVGSVGTEIVWVAYPSGSDDD